MRYVDGNLHVGEAALNAVYTEEADFLVENPDIREEYEIEESDIAEIKDFLERFKVVDQSALENEDLYYGMNFIFVVERLTDGKTFGVSYFHGGGKYGESQFRDAADYHTDEYVLKPVVPHAIPTFKFEEKND